VSIQKRPICPISALGKNFNPQNTLSIPVVKIFACLELEQIFSSLDGHSTEKIALHSFYPPLAGGSRGGVIGVIHENCRH
jgi:hypothetical protein